ncbi:MAG: response regulator [Fibrobacterales bacterium]
MDNLMSSILLVDDSKQNIDAMKELLNDSYELYLASNGREAIKIAYDKKPDLIILDVIMPGMDGFEVCDTLKKNQSTQEIPIVFMSAKASCNDVCDGLGVGADDFISKPFVPKIFKARVKVHLKIKRHFDDLQSLVKGQTLGVDLMQRVLIESIGEMAKYRDPETGGHIKRTQNYVKALAIEMQHNQKYRKMLNESYIDMLHMTAQLHDVGKIQIPDSILLKPGQLSRIEFKEMKKHVQYGVEILDTVSHKLRDNGHFTVARDLIGYHHEKWDGSGYPNGLKGDDIPLAGRIMAIADVYDALISKRVYKEPLSQESAVAIITEGSGTHFDPELVAGFLRIQETFRKIAITYADFEEEIINLGGEVKNGTKATHKIRTILLAESMDISVEIMKNQLEALGYTVVIASTGVAAIESFTNNKPDIVLTDSEMRNRDGDTVADTIREMDIFIPIYLLKENDCEMAQHEIKAHGFTGCLLKPLDEVVLKKILTEQ